MSGFLALQIINYISFGVFVCLFIGRTISIARLPSGLRWELYPIPGRNGEGPGGKGDLNSFGRLMQELRYMAKEILLFRTYFKRRKSYWYFVYPLHISMYLYILWVFFILAGALALAKGVQHNIGVAGRHDGLPILRNLFHGRPQFFGDDTFHSGIDHF